MNDIAYKRLELELQEYLKENSYSYTPVFNIEKKYLDFFEFEKSSQIMMCDSDKPMGKQVVKVLKKDYSFLSDDELLHCLDCAAFFNYPDFIKAVEEIKLKKLISNNKSSAPRKVL